MLNKKNIYGMMLIEIINKIHQENINELKKVIFGQLDSQQLGF